MAAGVLGIAAGVTSALVVEADDPSPSERVEDPLHLHIPLVSLDCTGDSLLVVARGDSAAPLAAAVANNPDLELSYLRTEDSCQTIYGPPSQGEPQFVVYAGPYDGMSEPCELRMSDHHQGDAVTNLSAGTETFVKCLCVLPVATFPELRPNMPADPGDAVWVRSLQSMLIDLDDQREADGEDGPFFKVSDVTGLYDETTQQRIEAYQAEGVFEASENGSVLFDTWRAITDETCRLYSF